MMKIPKNLIEYCVFNRYKWNIYTHFSYLYIYIFIFTFIYTFNLYIDYLCDYSDTNFEWITAQMMGVFHLLCYETPVFMTSSNDPKKCRDCSKDRPCQTSPSWQASPWPSPSWPAQAPISSQLLPFNVWYGKKQNCLKRRHFLQEHCSWPCVFYHQLKFVSNLVRGTNLQAHQKP